MKNECLARDRLKYEVWTGSIQTGNDSSEYNNYGLYSGSGSVSALTGYDATKWGKKVFCMVVKASDNNNGAIIYSSSYRDADSAILVSTPKPSRNVGVQFMVLYYE